MTADSRPRATRLAIELALLLVIAIAVTWLSTVIYPLAGLPRIGPAPQRTILLALAVGALLRHSGRTWSEFGLRRTLAWRQLVLATLLLLAAKVLVVQPVADLLRSALGMRPSDYTFFWHIHGNPIALLMWLAIAWAAGGFAEELVFRGWLMGRLAEVLGHRRLGWTVAVVVQALVFGAGHLYAGIGSAISATLSASLYAGVYLLAERSLWPLIIAHGIWDSLGFLVIYLQGVPNQ